MIYIKADGHRIVEMYSTPEVLDGYIPVGYAVTPETHYVKNGAVRRYPQKLDAPCVFNIEDECWELDESAAVEQVLERIASDRYEKEAEGLVWIDPISQQQIYLGTSIESQNRFTTARLAVEAGVRIDGGVWKCVDITENSRVVFLPTTNARIVEWSSLVHDHVQRCFEAEAIAVEKVLAGNLDVDFNSEFNRLT